MSELLTVYTAITKALLEEGIDKKYLKIALELAETNTEDLDAMLDSLIDKMKDKLKD